MQEISDIPSYLCSVVILSWKTSNKQVMIIAGLNLETILLFVQWAGVLIGESSKLVRNVSKRLTISRSIYSEK